MKTITRRAALTTGAAVLAMPFIARMALAQDQTVNVYNWADYIGETAVADFEKATGIKVVYDHYNSAEAAEAKMMAGSTGYDVVFIASRALPTMIGAGILAKLDKSKLPNISHMDPVLMEILAKLDPRQRACACPICGARPAPPSTPRWLKRSCPMRPMARST